MQNSYEVLEKETDVTKSVEQKAEAKDLEVEAAFELEDPPNNNYEGALKAFVQKWLNYIKK